MRTAQVHGAGARDKQEQGVRLGCPGLPSDGLGVHGSICVAGRRRHRRGGPAKATGRRKTQAGRVR